MSPKVPQFDDFVDKGVELETPPNRSRRHNAASSATITDTIGSKQAQPRSSSTCLSEQWDDSFHSLSASLSTLDLDGSSPTSTAGGESPTSNHGLLNSSSRRLQQAAGLTSATLTTHAHHTVAHPAPQHSVAHTGARTAWTHPLVSVWREKHAGSKLAL